MAVLVQTPVQNDATRSTRHDNGFDIDVREQHLFVESSNGTVAIYAPGQWFTAKVETEAGSAAQ